MLDRRACSHARTVSAAPQSRAREPVSRARFESRYGRSTARRVYPGVPVAARLARRSESRDVDRSRVGARRVSLSVATRPADPDRPDGRRRVDSRRRADRRSPPARARWRAPAVRGARRARRGIAARVHAARDRWSPARRGRGSGRLDGDRDQAARVARAQARSKRRPRRIRCCASFLRPRGERPSHEAA